MSGSGDEVRAGDGPDEISAAVHSGMGDVTPFDPMAIDGGLFPDVDYSPGAKRGPGRPLGAKNKASSELRKYILANYRHPLLSIMDVVAMTPAQVRREFGLNAKNAASLWMNAVFKALKYLAQEMPQAVVMAGVDFKVMAPNISLEPIVRPEDDDITRNLKSLAKSVGYLPSQDFVAQLDVAQDDLSD